ncbi:MAG: hypothetical protein HQL56_00310 [Magnetococcales bacterium]|nr:hypothetical protein [Magnetococcales bacterium]
MKQKYLGLVSVSVLGLGMAGMIAVSGADLVPLLIAFQKKAAQSGVVTGSAPGDLAKKIPAIDPVVQESILKLAPNLLSLRSPSKSSLGDIKLQMLGYSSEAVTMDEVAINTPSESFDRLVITMAFVSGDKKYVVLDGRFYQEGDQIGESGASIRTITPEKVLLAGREVRQWIKVQNPMAEAPKGKADNLQNVDPELLRQQQAAAAARNATPQQGVPNLGAGALGGLGGLVGLSNAMGAAAGGQAAPAGGNPKDAFQGLGTMMNQLRSGQ